MPGTALLARFADRARIPGMQPRPALVHLVARDVRQGRQAVALGLSSPDHALVGVGLAQPVVDQHDPGRPETAHIPQLGLGELVTGGDARRDQGPEGGVALPVVAEQIRQAGVPRALIPPRAGAPGPPAAPSRRPPGSGRRRSAVGTGVSLPAVRHRVTVRGTTRKMAATSARDSPAGCSSRRAVVVAHVVQAADSPPSGVRCRCQWSPPHSRQRTGT